METVMEQEILVYRPDGHDIRRKYGDPLLVPDGQSKPEGEILEGAELSVSNLESARKLLRGETDRPQAADSGRAQGYIYSLEPLRDERLEQVHSFSFDEAIVEPLDYPEDTDQEALDELEDFLSGQIEDAADIRRDEMESVIEEYRRLQEKYTHPALRRRLEDRKSEVEKWRDEFELPDITVTVAQVLMAIPVEGYTDTYQLSFDWFKMEPVEDLGLVDRRQLQYQPDRRVTLYSSRLDEETREQAMSIIQD